MPIYEYDCKNCGDTREEFSGSFNPSPPRCPECGAIMKRVISASSFSVKGFNAKNGYAGANKNDA